MDTPEYLNQVAKVKNTIQLYIDGAEGNPGQLQSAFHTDARMFGHIGETRRYVPITDFIDGVRAAKNKLTGDRYRAELVDVRVIGEAAIVTLVEQDYRGCDSINYFTLAKYGDAWKIVSKTFTCIGGEFS